MEGDPILGILASRSHVISIHALRVEGDVPESWQREAAQNISIHALRVEGDLPRGCPPEKCDKFLSTPSGWRATGIAIGAELAEKKISIHALRVEGD